MSEWRVEVTWQTPGPLPDEALAALAEAADDEQDWFVGRWAAGDGVELSGYLSATSATVAAVVFTDQVVRWMFSSVVGKRLIKRGLAGSVVAVRVCTPELFEREVTMPS